MPPISSTRRTKVGYHLAEAEAWLESSGMGQASTHLSYAAFELRLEIERIGIELILHVQGQSRKLSISDVRNFKNMENRLYQLEGNQRVINRKAEFWNIFLSALQVPLRIHAVNVGRLHSRWGECSELCHVLWTFRSESAEIADLRQLYVDLATIRDELRQIVTNGIAWPQLRDRGIEELIEAFVRGDSDTETVLKWIHTRGLWARMQSEGTWEFAGIPVPPQDDGD